MKIRLFYLKLELKRALKCLPLMAAGAAVLMFFMGAAALLQARPCTAVAAGRITVGVALPENDILAKQVTSMLSSLESVKSICDLSYMSREECLEGMENGELLAALLIPEGFVQDIMSGVNTPVPVLLPENAGVESRIFKELADAGAQTLSAAQAGIYAGDEVLDRFHCSEARAQLSGI
ncbi:MAG: ABC transporter permease [Enterocloster sp.]